MRSPLGRMLIGGMIGAAVAALAAWASGPPAAPRLLIVVLAAASAGAAAGWWLYRRYERPLDRLRLRLEGWTDRDGAAMAGEPAPRAVAELAAAVDRLTDRLHRRARAREGERAQLAEILEAMSDGVLVTDRDRRLELINPSFRALFELQGIEVERLEARLSESLIDFIDELDAGGAVSRQRVETEAGRWLELRGRRLSSDRAVVVARDLTEQLRLNATIRDLVANVSHELRTPLTAIRGYAENLDEGAIEEASVARRFVDRILAQCRRLDALLADLLALSRIERSEQIPAAELESTVDLEALAARAVETVGRSAEERDVRITLEASPVAAISGSEEALETMLLNLLENAIKYNREGGSVTMSLTQQGGELLIQVSDTGIGMPQKDLPRIFERFYRVDRGRSRAEGGTGLGLAIVKHSAQLHGGGVEVESRIGRGSVFRVRLPIAG